MEEIDFLVGQDGSSESDRLEFDLFEKEDSRSNVMGDVAKLERDEKEMMGRKRPVL